MKYYAVKVGLHPGIYNTWDECQKNVVGFKGAIYKSFSSLEDAKLFLSDKEKEENGNNPIAYVDGSYNSETEEYSFGAVLLIDSKEFRFKKKFPKDKYSVSRNVAGEIRGASFIINYAKNLGIKELDLYYDYMGIEKWYKGDWSTNKEISELYKEFADSVKKDIKVNFIKVKSHSNNKYNDIVDSLAKEALGIK